MKHLDEGTIHAWLDGALGAGEAAEVERHAAECGECAARVAEARGLIAGASRILSALDDVGAEIVPARAPEVKRKRRGPRATRVVAWLAAAGVVVAVGLRTRGRPGPESTPVRGVSTGPSPAGIAESLIDSIEVIKGAPASTYGAYVGSPAISVKVAQGDSQRAGRSDGPSVGRTERRQTAAKSATVAAEAAKTARSAAAAAPSAPAGESARRGVAANVAVLPDSTTLPARARAGAAALKAQDAMATTAAEPHAPSAELGRVPMCFEELPAAPAMAPVTGGVPRIAPKAMAGAARVGADVAASTSADHLDARLVSTVLMLDSTPASAVAADARPARLLLNGDGVTGEWQRLGATGASGGDSLVLRFGRPVTRVLPAALTPNGLKIGARVLVRVRCEIVKR